jgi:dihydroneopterin aldolase/2-amino-4-hydroxy-6-hydroxymethyldihydropteridine diphosphokinase/dihydropteroate synthase
LRLQRRFDQVIEGSQFLTLEALTSNIANQALKLSNEVEDDVVVCVSKPQAIPSARSAQICLRRSRRDFGYPESSLKNTQEQSTLSDPSFASKVMEMVSTSPPAAHTVSIAFGTNLGDRFANIEHALRLLEDPMSISKARLATDGSFDAKTYIIDTSFLYETAPMYVTDQPDFVNGACLVRASGPGASISW